MRLLESAPATSQAGKLHLHQWDRRWASAGSSMEPAVPQTGTGKLSLHWLSLTRQGLWGQEGGRSRDGGRQPCRRVNLGREEDPESVH